MLGGNTINLDNTYSDLILEASKTSNVSAYHLASRIRQEIGYFLSHNSISGTFPGYEGYYNFYNIGATSSTEPNGAIRNGLEYAKSGKNASEEIKQRYYIPWNTPNRSITGGAIFIGSSYISIGQYNLYLQKFDVNDAYKSNLFWHQYMTNCLAPYNESYSIWKAYNSNGMINNSMTFVIPVYDNMPTRLSISPDINPSDYIEDDTRVYANVNNVLNIRSGPSVNSEVIYTARSGEKMTRIGLGVQNGERWDRVVLDNGIEGYAFQSYIEKIRKPDIASITLNIANTDMQRGTSAEIIASIYPDEVENNNIIWTSSNENIVSVKNGTISAISEGTATITAKAEVGNATASVDITVYVPVSEIIISKENLNMIIGEIYTIKASLIPEDVTNKSIMWYSSNENVATVNTDGTVTAIGEGECEIIISSGNQKKTCNVVVKIKDENVVLEFDENLRVEVDEISNIDCTVLEFNELINTNLNIEIYNSKNELLEDEDYIGTDSKLILKDEDNNIIYEYTFIKYGDVNGDGVINSLDVLVLQKHILEIKTLTGAFLKAGNISRSGATPSSLDILKIQKHILEIKLIQQ